MFVRTLVPLGRKPANSRAWVRYGDPAIGYYLVFADGYVYWAANGEIARLEWWRFW